MALTTFPDLTEDNTLRLSRCNYKRFLQFLEHIKAGTSELWFGHGLDLKVNPVCYNNQGWVGWEVGEGQAPRDESLDFHFIMVPKRKMDSLRHLTIQDKLGYWIARDWIFETYDVPGCYIIERDGDPTKHAGAKDQAGFEVKVPTGEMPVFETFMKTPEKARANMERCTRFLSFYNTGMTLDQFVELVERKMIDKDGVNLV